MLGLPLALACALAWAGLDVVRKQLGHAIAPLALLVLLNVGLVPVFAIAWWATGGTITDLPAYAGPAGGALVLQVIANLLFLAALRASPLSLTVPLLALTPVFATVFGVVWLDERPDAVQIVGITLVVAGALALGSVVGTDARPQPRRSFVRERGPWMMLAVAACWGVSTGLDKLALVHATVPIHALVQLGGVIAAGLVALATTRRLSELVHVRAHLQNLVIATVAGSAALGLQLIAVQHILVSQVETIKRAIGLVSAIVLGKLVFGEPITAVKVVAILVMVAGVALLMLGTPS